MAILASLVILDQNRIQPWVYQYGAVLLLLSTYTWKPNSHIEQGKILNVLRLMTAGIYFYSGLQKVNPVFIGSVFPWMLQPFIKDEYYLLGVLIAMFIPFMEMFIGLGLLFKKTRFIALVGVIAMLFFVLSSLGSFGHNWNVVVWPWNIVFASLAFILFWKFDKSFFHITLIPLKIIPVTIVVLFVCCPALFFFDKWDGYPSFSLYSGQTARLNVSFPTGTEVDEKLQPYVIEGSEEVSYVNVTEFAIADIHVPIYPETRVHKVVAKEFCHLLLHNENITIEYQPSLHWARNHQTQTHTCADLSK